MPDSIAIINGTPAFASFRENPWHSLGHVFQDQVDGPEMLRRAQLDWDVVRAPLVARMPLPEPVLLSDGTMQTHRDVPHPSLDALCRSNDGALLGTVSGRYHIFQNREMANVLDAIAGETGAVYETAGALYNGARVWVMAHIPDMDWNIKNDAMRQYMLVTTSHDGSAALTIMPTTIRVVCANTMRMALRRAPKRGKGSTDAGWSIRHKPGLPDLVADAVDAFKRIREANVFSREMWAALAEIPATPDATSKVATYVASGGARTDLPDDVSQAGRTRTENRVAEFRQVLESGTNQTDATKGTMWGLLNAATEWVDHKAQVNETEKRKTDPLGMERARFESAQFGRGAEIKAGVESLILELAGV